MFKRGSAVFGYIRIDKGELLVREYEAYKAVYCGLCRQMGKDYSFLSRLALSYDCTFYALFLMALRRDCTGFEKKHCRFNPLKKCQFCKCRDDALSKAAALTMILSYHKLDDNISDSGFFRALPYRLIKPLFSRWRKKAAERYPELDEAARRMMKAQREAEDNPDCTLDMAADPTAAMLSSVLSLEAEDEAQRRILAQTGYGIGRFIFFIDAVDDYKKDVKTGGFNPLCSLGESRFEIINRNLSQALASAFDAYNLLTVVDFKGIIDNILLRGLPGVQAEIVGKNTEASAEKADGKDMKNEGSV